MQPPRKTKNNCVSLSFPQDPIVIALMQRKQYKSHTHLEQNRGKKSIAKSATHKKLLHKIKAAICGDHYEGARQARSIGCKTFPHLAILPISLPAAALIKASRCNVCFGSFVLGLHCSLRQVIRVPNNRTTFPN